MTNSSNNNRNLLTFLTGIIAGAAATYYLNTPSGKQLTNRIVNGTREMKDDLVDRSTRVAENISSKASDLAGKASEKYEEIKTKTGEFVGSDNGSTPRTSSSKSQTSNSRKTSVAK